MSLYLKVGIGAGLYLLDAGRVLEIRSDDARGHWRGEGVPVVDCGDLDMRIARDGTLHVNTTDSVWAFELGQRRGSESHPGYIGTWGRQVENAIARLRRAPWSMSRPSDDRIDPTAVI